MNLVKSNDKSQPPKTIEHFINTPVLPQSHPETRFFNQQIYNYATNIVNNSPENHSEIDFHYTGHNKSGISNDISINNNIYDRSTKSRRLSLKSRISDYSSENFQNRRYDFNSVLQSNKLNKSAKDGWKTTHYKFQCADRKKEYALLDKYNVDDGQLFSHKVRKYEHRNLDRYANRSQDFDILKNKSREVIKISLLENPNYLHYHKYNFPETQPNQKVKRDHFINPRPWTKLSKDTPSIIQHPRISLIYENKLKPQKEIEDRLKLINKPLQARDKLHDLGDGSVQNQRKVKKMRWSRDINYDRGVLDILYPKTSKK